MASSKPDYLRRALGFAAAALLIGPPVGAVFIVTLVPIIEVMRTKGASFAHLDAAAIANFLAAILLAVPVSYVMGGLAALLSAAWIGVRTWISGRFGYIEAVLTSIAATSLTTTARLPDSLSFTLADLILPSGVVSAIAVRMFLSRWMRHERG